MPQVSSRSITATEAVDFRRIVSDPVRCQVESLISFSASSDWFIFRDRRTRPQSTLDLPLAKKGETQLSFRRTTSAALLLCHFRFPHFSRFASDTVTQRRGRGWFIWRIVVALMRGELRLISLEMTFYQKRQLQWAKQRLRVSQSRS